MGSYFGLSFLFPQELLPPFFKFPLQFSIETRILLSLLSLLRGKNWPAVVKFALDAFGVQLSGNKVRWNTHSQSFARIFVQVGSMIEEFQDLALNIFLFSSNRHIYLDVVWFPWDQNSKVDILN